MRTQRRGLFLLYARKDGELFAEDVRRKLNSTAPGIEIKQDRLFLEGGRGFWLQLTAAIDSVEFLVLVVTPLALESKWVGKEWQYARQQGVCVYPIVKAMPDPALPVDSLPLWMRRVHGSISRRNGRISSLTCKRAAMRRVCPSWLRTDLTISSSVRRCSLASSISCSRQVREFRWASRQLSRAAAASGRPRSPRRSATMKKSANSTDDGILWVTLGEQPAVLGGLVTLSAALLGERPGFASVDDGAFQLGQKLEDRNCLRVVDDVWNAGHLKPFLRGGKTCARLFTTRDDDIAAAFVPAATQRTNVDQMRRAEAVALLGKDLPELTHNHAVDLSHRLGDWPLALELARAMMAQRTNQGASADLAAKRMLAILDKKGVSALKDGTAEPRHQSIANVLEASIDRLSGEDQRRLVELSIFHDDVAIPLDAAGAVWGIDDLATEETAQHLAQLSLVKQDLDRETLRMHDVMRSWLAISLRDTARLHSRLVDSWPDWLQLPSQYAWLWLPWHLVQAGRHDDLNRLLWDPKWLQAKIAAAGVNALMAGLEDRSQLKKRSYWKAPSASPPMYLDADPQQFSSQLVGRLLEHVGEPTVRQFVDSVTRAARYPWLRPLWPALHAPGGGLLRTLTGHSDRVNSVAVCPDNRRAVSASLDKTLVVWDLSTGARLHTLLGHAHFVWAIAVSSDGRFAASASWDRTVKIWDLESGVELRTLAGHRAGVWGVAVTPDGQRCVSASTDRTLALWDIETGA